MRCGVRGTRHAGGDGVCRGRGVCGRGVWWDVVYYELGVCVGT